MTAMKASRLKSVHALVQNVKKGSASSITPPAVARSTATHVPYRKNRAKKVQYNATVINARQRIHKK
ncbi:MAG: hypothetical protein D3909_12635 [Candidatus Electrothrix sp. ATG1]|nr:hypothetical protein [Candidatus Electrothrix sp. ATG1]